MISVQLWDPLSLMLMHFRDLNPVLLQLSLLVDVCSINCVMEALLRIPHRLCVDSVRRNCFWCCFGITRTTCVTPAIPWSVLCTGMECRRRGLTLFMRYLLILYRNMVFLRQEDVPQMKGVCLCCVCACACVCVCVCARVLPNKNAFK